MPRSLQPDEMLAAVYPRVAATWHPTANLPLTAETVAPNAKHKVVWRCAAGHEWEDIVATRIALPAWKKGDRAACRVCVGYHSIVTFDCGHTAEVKTDFSDPARGCPACRHAAFAARQDAYSAGARLAQQHFEEDKQIARQLLEAVDTSGLPVPLRTEWRYQAQKMLRSAVAQERHHGVDGAVERTLAALHSPTLESLVPEQVLEGAVRQRKPVTVFRRAFWAPGWRVSVEGQPRTAVMDATAVDGLRQHLEAAVSRAASDGAAGRHSVSELTTWLTENVAAWAYGQVADRPGRWNVYRELSLPVAPRNSSRYGRLDVTVMRPGGPDLVVEIDSAHNDGSVEKLVFVRDAGAVPVWVRWHSGRVEAPAGVAVIDLVEITRSLAA